MRRHLISWCGVRWLSAVAAGLAFLGGSSVRADEATGLPEPREVASIDRRAPELEASARAAGSLQATLFTLLSPFRPVAAPPQLSPRRSSTVALAAIDLPHGLDEQLPVPARTAMDELARTLLGCCTGSWGLDGGGTCEPIPAPDVPADPRYLAVERLAVKVFYRQLRRVLGSALRDRYSEDYTYDYFDYVAERERISRLDPERRVESRELIGTRATILENERDEVLAEQPRLTIAAWGPLRIDDYGHVRIDLERLRDDPVSGTLTLAPDDFEKPLGESLFKGRIYRINTDLKVKPRLREVGTNFREFAGEVGAAVGIDLFTPILEKRYLGAELETTYDEEGRAGFFVTFKLYGRR